ncbi:MAG: type IV pilus assembly protein PilV [Motiliproteus sp.]|jgi:type IV pilus assembly protein PilV
MPLAPWPRLRACRQQGVSMVEVLIALLLMVTTLLGATALQITGLQTNRSAYYRTQASLLSYDIADRIRLNASYASGDNDRYSVDTDTPATPSATSCASGALGCSSQSLRDLDIREWSEHFIDVTGIGHDNGDYKPVLPGGTGKVTASGAHFSIQISWQELDWNIGGGANKADTTKTFTLDFTAAR